MAAVDDDVPPLEDCSEMVKKANDLRASSTNNSSSAKMSIPDKKSGRETDAVNGTTTGSVEAPKKNEKEFGGMRKGFLFGPKPAKKPASATAAAIIPKRGDDLPLIAPKQTKEEALRIDEVQESMKNSPGLKQAWITDELITKMIKNEKLSKWLTDPQSTKVLEEFQSNPQAALIKYKDKPEILQFFRDFGGLMKDHFSSLEQEEEEKKKKKEEAVAASQGADIRPAVDADAERALQNPEVREALMDEDVQRAIQAIKENPANGDRILDKADSKLRHHLTVLLKNGVIGLRQA